MIKIEQNVYHTQAKGCFGLIQLGTMAIYILPKFWKGGSPLLMLELFKPITKSLYALGGMVLIAISISILLLKNHHFIF